MSKTIRTLDDARRAVEHTQRPIKAPVEATGEYARQRRDAARDSAARVLERAEREQRQPTVSERRTIDSEMASADLWGKRFRSARRDQRLSAERAFVTREPLTYARGGDHSFFRDLLASKDDPDASQRLERNARQMRFAYAQRSAEAHKAEQRGDAYEFRVTPTVATAGTLAPPLYLIEDAALVPRAARVFSRYTTNLPLGDGVQSIRVPSIASLTGAVSPQVEGTPVTSSGIADAEQRSDVITIAGQTDVALALSDLSRPGAGSIDAVIYRSLLDAYDESIEQQCVAGGGLVANGRQMEFTGVTKLAGVTEVSVAGTTGAEVFVGMGRAFGAVAAARRQVPTNWFVTGNRWAAFNVERDESGRNLNPPVDSNSQRTVEPIGNIIGAPCSISQAVTDSLAIIAKPSDAFLWESAPRLRVMTDTLAGDLTARIQLWAYAAFVPRQVTSIGIVKNLPTITWSEA